MLSTASVSAKSAFSIKSNSELPVPEEDPTIAHPRSYIICPYDIGKKFYFTYNKKKACYETFIDFTDYLCEDLPQEKDLVSIDFAGATNFDVETLYYELLDPISEKQYLKLFENYKDSDVLLTNITARKKLTYTNSVPLTISCKKGLMMRIYFESLKTSDKKEIVFVKTLDTTNTNTEAALKKAYLKSIQAAQPQIEEPEEEAADEDTEAEENSGITGILGKAGSFSDSIELMEEQKEQTEAEAAATQPKKTTKKTKTPKKDTKKTDKTKETVEVKPESEPALENQASETKTTEEKAPEQNTQTTVEEKTTAKKTTKAKTTKDKKSTAKKADTKKEETKTEDVPAVENITQVTAGTPAAAENKIQDAVKTETQEEKPAEKPAASTIEAPAADKTAPAAEQLIDMNKLLESANENKKSKYKREYLQDFAVEELPDLPSDAENEQILIENPDEANAGNFTLLMKAAKAGNDWEIKLLINSGADVNAVDKDGWTALMYAVRYQENLESVKLLLNAGAVYKNKDNFNTSPIVLAACFNNNPEILKQLLGLYTNSDKEVLRALVMLLSDNNAPEYIQKAKLNTFVNSLMPLNVYYQGKTPLMYACQYGRSTALIQVLLDNNCSVTARSTEGLTAFDYASKNNNLEHNATYWALNKK